MTVEVKKLTVVTPKGGVELGCKKCGRVYAKGVAVIEVRVKGRVQPYLLGYAPTTPPTICCGEEKKTPRLFNSTEEAGRAAEEFQKQLESPEGADPVLLEYGTPMSPEDMN